MTTKEHTSASKKGSYQNRLNITSTSDVEDFYINLTNALIVSNIPLNKLTNHTFKSFLEEISEKKINSISFYRNKIIGLLCESMLTKLQVCILELDEFYIIFDETTDLCGRYILNILCRKCSSNQRCKPWLIGTIQLTKKCW